MGIKGKTAEWKSSRAAEDELKLLADRMENWSSQRPDYRSSSTAARGVSSGELAPAEASP